MKTKVDKILGYFLAAMLCLMTLDVLWGVFTRYAMGNQASWTEELARFLLIWIGLLGAAWASGQGLHLSIDLIKNKPVRFISGVIIAFAATAMVIGGGNLVRLTAQLGQTSAAMGIPMAAVYAVVPISGLFIIYYRLLDFVPLSSGPPTAAAKRKGSGER